MELLFWILGFCLIGGLLSVMIAASVLLIPESRRQIILPHLISFALGTLLGASFLGLIPHALTDMQNDDPHHFGLTLLLGVFAFFILEKFVLWRHCHQHHCDGHWPHSNQNDATHLQKREATGTIILVGDSIHNFIDGILIAAAFLTDIQLGIVTAIAIAAHEIPQELGDFIILLHSGFKRKKALYYNLLSSLSTVIGGLIGFYGFSDMESMLPYVLLIAASSFIYIAISDLIPTLHQRDTAKESLQQVVLILLGIFFIFISHNSMH